MRKRLFLSFFVILLFAFNASAQKVHRDLSFYSAEVISRTHPGVLVRDYDRFYMNGVLQKDYQLYNMLSPENYFLYEEGKRLYRASSWTAFAGISLALVGGTMAAFSKRSPDNGFLKAGPYVAAGGAVVFAVSLPMDFSGLRKLKTVSERHARKTDP